MLILDRFNSGKDTNQMISVMEKKLNSELFLFRDNDMLNIIDLDRWRRYNVIAYLVQWA